MLQTYIFLTIGGLQRRYAMLLDKWEVNNKTIQARLAVY
jgi:hypothetical protein